VALKRDIGMGGFGLRSVLCCSLKMGSGCRVINSGCRGVCLCRTRLVILGLLHLVMFV
jgi:hypothetical protein